MSRVRISFPAPRKIGHLIWCPIFLAAAKIRGSNLGAVKNCATKKILANFPFPDPRRTSLSFLRCLFFLLQPRFEVRILAQLKTALQRKFLRIFRFPLDNNQDCEVRILAQLKTALQRKFLRISRFPLDNNQDLRFES